MIQAQQLITALERQVGPHAKSPMFAQLAEAYLAADRPKDALRVCDAGIANFPYYSTGHLIKGRALLALKMNSEARREFEIVRNWLPTNPSVRSLIESIPVSDDEVLTAPAAEGPKPAHNTPESSVADPAHVESKQEPENFFGAITSGETPQAAVETGSTTESAAEVNVFGLPSQAPTTEPGTPGSEQSMQPEPDAFAAFGQSGGSDAGFGTSSTPESTGPTATSEESFEQYSSRMRSELGPAGTMTMEEFMSGANGASVQPPTPIDEYLSTGTDVPVVEAPASDPFGESTAAAPATEASDPFGASTADGFGSSPTIDQPQESAASDPFASFGAGEVETPQAESGVESVSAEPSGDFAGPDFSGLPAPSATESPSIEDFGSEQPKQEEQPADTGFAGPDFTGPEPAAGGGSIEELTEKLKTAKKITPVIDFSSKASSSSASEDTLAGTGFVTPTLAEIYAKQGWYDDAIKAYRTLIRTKPAESNRFEERIAELEEMKKQQS